LTASDRLLDLMVATPNTLLPAGTSLYLSLTTPQGAPATADFWVYGQAF
jgi:hypothetical protein